MTEVKIISCDVSKIGQEARKIWVLLVGDDKVRVSIKSDAYQAQCHARSEIWDATKKGWNFVHHIQQGSMNTPNGLAYRSDYDNAKHYEADYEELLKVTLQIIQ